MMLSSTTKTRKHKSGAGSCSEEGRLEKVEEEEEAGRKEAENELIGWLGEGDAIAGCGWEMVGECARVGKLGEEELGEEVRAKKLRWGELSPRGEVEPRGDVARG